jgi:heme-degrading monooxygenase HmoA
MYTIVWEFHPRTGKEAEFERAYGPEGDWVQLFRKGEGYVGTDLLHDVDAADRYLTVDRWTSEPAYRAFKHSFHEEYAALDEKLAALSSHETRVGAFVHFPNPRRSS